MPQPIKGEKKDTFIQRCMADEESVGSYPDESQRYAVCNRVWETHTREALSLYKKSFVGSKISFDYDDVLSTDKGLKMAQDEVKKGNVVYIVSARREKDGMLKRAQEAGVIESRIFATGSNKAKVEKVKELGIATHYDNNTDVIKELGSIGKLFK